MSNLGIKLRNVEVHEISYKGRDGVVMVSPLCSSREFIQTVSKVE